MRTALCCTVLQGLCQAGRQAGRAHHWIIGSLGLHCPHCIELLTAVHKGPTIIRACSPYCIGLLWRLGLVADCVGQCFRVRERVCVSTHRSQRALHSQQPSVQGVRTATTTDRAGAGAGAGASCARARSRRTGLLPRLQQRLECAARQPRTYSTGGSHTVVGTQLMIPPWHQRNSAAEYARRLPPRIRLYTLSTVR